MSIFHAFATAIKNQVNVMSETGLFMTSTDKGALWDLYLSSFPKGTNPIYRERTEHDCTCCKQFIRNIGGVVTIRPDYTVVSVWDALGLKEEYAVVAQALSAFVKQHAIVDVYYNDSSKVGIERNHEMVDGAVRTYNHFHAVLAPKYVLRSDEIAAKKGEVRQAVEVFRRSAEELSLESADIVMELIDQNSLYRGEEHRDHIYNFQQFKANIFPRTENFDEAKKAAFYWYEGTRGNTANIVGSARALGIRNTVIGTLLTDISNGAELEQAVRSFESKVAPQNYKRPTAVVSKRMIEDAKKAVEDLGLTDSLARRFARYDDLTINNVLFADLAAQKAMDPFAHLTAKLKPQAKSLDKVEEVSVNDFLENILPKAHSMEVLVENSHVGNLMSLIAPATAGAPNLFKWGNGFSWSYNGEVADSIKQRVKTAGGNVESFLRVSLAWHNNDDLDLSLVDPCLDHVYYHNRRSTYTGAVLDIDMNGIDGLDPKRAPVENIFFQKESALRNGAYTFVVTNFNQRERIDVGFEIEVEYKGQISRFSHAGLGNKERVVAVRLVVRDGQVVEVKSDLCADTASQQVWGIETGSFKKVQLVLNSPNHWDGEQTGNKHVFFILEGCKNPQGTRGFYNEYLKPELTKHRKVFEDLGAMMKAEPSDEQLSGLGFSTTQRNHLFVKVSGSFNRTVKVVF